MHSLLFLKEKKTFRHSTLALSVSLQENLQTSFTVEHQIVEVTHLKNKIESNSTYY